MRYILLLICLLPVLLYAQDCQNPQKYQEKMLAADSCIQAGNFSLAYDNYSAARIYCRDSTSVVEEAKAALFQKINNLRAEAVKARSKADILNNTMRINNLRFAQFLNQQVYESYELSRQTAQLADGCNSLPAAAKDELREQTLLSQAFRLEYLSEFDLALVLADSLCTHYPSSRSYDCRSIIYYYLKNWKEAVADADKAIALERMVSLRPKVHTPWNKALALSNLGRYDAALVNLDTAMQLLQEQADEDQYWYDNHLQDEIVTFTGINSVFFFKDEMLRAMRLFKLFNQIYKGPYDARHFSKLRKESFTMSAALLSINYALVHAEAIPEDYVAYLLIGYLWELARYPDAATVNYQKFLEGHQKWRSEKYQAYASGFGTELYRQLSKEYGY